MNAPADNAPTQQELPFAIVQGEPLSAPPVDLYIPPDALEVILEAFEGPLDLLLYLIKRQNLDILDIPVAPITAQYMQYIEMMQSLRLDLAAEYLVMASVLTEIKSRMLLPRPAEIDEEEDPRADLVRRLQEYEQFRQAADDLDRLPRMHRDHFPVDVEIPEVEQEAPLPQVELRELLLALQDVLQRSEMYSHHHVERETLTVRAKMSQVLERLRDHDGFLEFPRLFDASEGRLGVVVSFLALLELLREHLIDLVQSDSYATIHVSLAGEEEKP